MTPETFEALRTGTDKRPWLVIGGPHDGKVLHHITNAHICTQQMATYVGKDGCLAYAVYNFDHDGHVLEFDPNPEWKRKLPSVDD